MRIEHLEAVPAGPEPPTPQPKPKEIREGHGMTDQMSEVWKFAQKRPLVVEFREVNGEHEMIDVPSIGRFVRVHRTTHYVMRDEAGEYPILKTIFAKTYDPLPKWLNEWRGAKEPWWKCDLVGRIWAYARENGLLIVDSAREDAGRERLPPGLGDLVGEIRQRCDRCGVTPKQAQIAEGSGS
jgi:hypothetical protein